MGIRERVLKYDEARFVSRLSSLEAREARILVQYSCSLLVIHTVLAQNGRLERECFVRLGGVLEV